MPIHFCDLSFDTPEENLACDEALLECCEEGLSTELLRFWEPRQHFVVVGYANKVTREVNLDYCGENRIPILRRCTGGGTVLQGPGVLNYSLVLRFDSQGPLQNITTTNDFILKRLTGALSDLLQKPVEMRGHTDMAINGVKFSGNAQRRKKHFLLFHGALLLHLELPLLCQSLAMPSSQPDYRQNRPHSEFVMNLNVEAAPVKAALRRAWEATEPLAPLNLERVEQLVAERYSQDQWNFKF